MLPSSPVFFSLDQAKGQHGPIVGLRVWLLRLVVRRWDGAITCSFVETLALLSQKRSPAGVKCVEYLFE